MRARRVERLSAVAVAIDTLRLRVRVGGTVQGVGFRPFVYRLAVELGLAGWVRNDERGVQLEIEGTREATRAFLARLRGEAPPLASVEEVSSAVAAALGERGFRILPSAGRLDEPNAHVAADAATCEDCLREMRDPRDRRYRYPFINCTNCGPRFTIVRGVPYDRRRTTMSSFRMCPACRAEYENPLDRRFHAQPNACPVCGPRALLLRADGTRDRGAAHERARAGAGGDTIARAARLLADGAILAVKGLGGYHLACRADEQATVAALRARKRREDRPFALMVADLDAARDVAAYDGCAAELLCSLARPIVLASRREGAAVTAAVAPGSAELGVMLPYAPLHHLLLADARALGVDALVMTSGNLSDEPIAYLDEDARRRLRSVADAFLVHDRPVHMRTDDSVARSVRLRSRCRPQLLRRSRGYVPDSTPLPVGARRPLLACGAELKSTFCLARGDRAWVGHHIGDLRNWETLRSFREGIEHFQELFGVRPELIAHDLHPDYLSTRYATERAESAAVADGQPQLLAVQHHHAHLAAVLAEHGERGPAVAAIYDGAGHGTDGAVWGGELLVGDLRGFTRVGHLRPVPLPGGDAAAREPWRMACAWIAETTADPSPPLPVGLGGVVEERRWGALAGILGVRCTAPPTTSVGRLCDAVAAICGAGKRVSYEGQAAVELEAAADGAERGSYELPFEHGQLDARPLIAAVMSEIDAGVPRGTVAARFHNALALATASACVQVAREHDLSLVALGGGVFQNRLLIEAAARDIEHAGLRVLVPERLPPNDGAISYGQAAIAAASAA